MLHNKYWKLQQDLPPHTSATQLEGSQVKRNILAKIKQDKIYKLADGAEMTGSELIRQVNNTDRTLSRLGKEQLFEEFGIEEQLVDGGFVYKMIDKTKLHEALISNFESKESTPEALIESLALTDDKTEFKYVITDTTYLGCIDARNSKELAFISNSLKDKETIEKWGK